MLGFVRVPCTGRQPSRWVIVAGRGVVKRLDEDIAAVVAVADAVVDLDPLGRGFVAARAGQDTGRAGGIPPPSAEPA